MGVKKVMKIILFAILAVILVVLIFFMAISTGKVKPYRDENGRLAKLESMVDHLENDEVKCNNWFSFIYLLHEAGGGTTLNETEFWGIDVPIIMSSCYTLKEKFDYIAGMKMYRKTPLFQESESADYMKEIPSLEIPVYFLSGEYDYNCPWPMVEKYCNFLQAPDKKFFKILFNSTF